MKKFINLNYGYKDSLDYKKRLKLIKKSKFDGVFIYSQYEPQAYIQDIIDEGLEIGSLHLSYKKFDEDGILVDKEYVNVIWQGGADTDEYLQTLYNEIDFANKYSIKTVVMHITGGANPPPFCNEGVEFIRKILLRCKQYGMVLCLENLRRIDYLIKVFEVIDDESLKFCFDSGHANYMTKNADNFPWDQLGRKLYYLHLNDNDTFSDQHFPPFYGTIKWEKLINIIYSYKRDIDLTLEVRNKSYLSTLDEKEFLAICSRNLRRLERKILLREYSLVDEYIKGYPYSLAYAERYLNDGSDSGFSKNSTLRKTSPKYGKQSFYLKNVKYSADIEQHDFGKIRDYLKDNTICVHPDICKPVETVDVSNGMLVSPTASGRTLICIEPNDFFFIKVAYTRCLGRLTRHMGTDKIKSAVEVTNLLKDASAKGKLNEKFAFLCEDNGRVVILKNNNMFIKNIDILNSTEKTYEYGVIIREGRAYPYIDKKEYLIPFFSLFSNEYYPGTNIRVSDRHEMLLIQLYKKQTKNLMDFLLEDIIFPLYHTYFDALIYAGVELEAHSQNMLLSIDENGHILRIVCRDLESAGRDIPLMEYFNISNSEGVSYKRNVILPKDEKQKYAKYYITHSFMFDFKLGEYLVTKLLNLVSNYDSSFSVDLAQSRIKQFNKKFIEKLPTDFFPPDWCDYEKINFEKEKRERVYQWHENPKYR